VPFATKTGPLTDRQTPNLKTDNTTPYVRGGHLKVFGLAEAIRLTSFGIASRAYIPNGTRIVDCPDTQHMLTVDNKTLNRSEMQLPLYGGDYKNDVGGNGNGSLVSSSTCQNSIGDLGTDMHRLMIRAIQEGAVTRNGATKPECSHFRLATATNLSTREIRERLDAEFLDQSRPGWRCRRRLRRKYPRYEGLSGRQPMLRSAPTQRTLETKTTPR
jgi:hypothetical protein